MSFERAFSTLGGKGVGIRQQIVVNHKLLISLGKSPKIRKALQLISVISKASKVLFLYMQAKP